MNNKKPRRFRPNDDLPGRDYTTKRRIARSADVVYHEIKNYLNILHNGVWQAGKVHQRQSFAIYVNSTRVLYFLKCTLDIYTAVADSCSKSALNSDFLDVSKCLAKNASTIHVAAGNIIRHMAQFPAA